MARTHPEHPEWFKTFCTRTSVLQATVLDPRKKILMMKEKDEPHGVMTIVAAAANCRCVGKDMTVTETKGKNMILF